MIKKVFFKKKWFFEKALPGEPQFIIWGMAAGKEIFSGRSKYQKIEIFNNENLGRVLVLDGRVQLSTKYEFRYHEMLVHPAMIYHSNPEKVLIIGGGDGGALREMAKHPVKEIFLVDIDKEIIKISRKYLPSVSSGAFNDKRLKIFIEDGLKFIKKFNNFFDIIIIDSTDPQGPSKKLFKIKFYRDIQRALRKEGIFAAQTGYYSDRWGKEAVGGIKRIFSFSKVIRVFVDCFPLGEQTFCLGSKKVNFDKFGPKEVKEKYEKLNLKTRYYSPEIHFSSLVFPKNSPI